MGEGTYYMYLLIAFFFSLALLEARISRWLDFKEMGVAILLL